MLKCLQKTTEVQMEHKLEEVEEVGEEEVEVVVVEVVEERV
jgi:hypothetical protein